MTIYRHSAVIKCLMLLCLGGCGRNNDLLDINGFVTYAGQPVEKGAISFQPIDGKGPTAAAVLTNGKYAVKASPGRKKVRIEGYRVIGQQKYMNTPNAPMVDIQEPIIPERYNAKSELTCEITPDNGPYDFNLD